MPSALQFQENLLLCQSSRYLKKDRNDHVFKCDSTVCPFRLEGPGGLQYGCTWEGNKIHINDHHCDVGSETAFGLLKACFLAGRDEVSTLEKEIQELKEKVGLELPTRIVIQRAKLFQFFQCLNRRGCKVLHRGVSMAPTWRYCTSRNVMRVRNVLLLQVRGLEDTNKRLTDLCSDLAESL